MSDEHIRLTLQGANRASKETGIDLMTILRQGFREMPQRLYIVENDDIKTAYRMAAENTKYHQALF